jgi:uncharacterized protein
MCRLKFRQLPEIFAVCQLPAYAPIPEWASRGEFFSITRTSQELSIVCQEANVPEKVKAEKDWACLKLEGPFPFAETGVLLSFVAPLSEAGVPIFAVATFNTDFVLVKREFLSRALHVLKQAGHQLVED